MLDRICTALLALVVTGCAGGGPEVDSLENALQSENALSMNALSMNALSMNALSMNALSMNALSMNGLEQELALDPDNPLIETAEGRHLLKYIVRCAIPAGATVVGESTEGQGSSTSYVFPGLLGLTPDWSARSLTSSEADALSSCLLAHVNYFGVSIAISARHPDLPVSQEELDRFTAFEGAFFGDLFAQPPVLFTCTGDVGPDFGVSYPDHDLDAGDRLLRRCTDVDGSETACGFTNVGSCASVCTILADGSAKNCHGPSGTFQEAMTIWLLDHDDPASTLDAVYDAYYGP